MVQSTSKFNLSERGHLLSAGNDTSQVFEIVRNVYHPETNPDGFVSLGLAENDLMHDEMVARIEKIFKLPKSHLTYLDGGAGSKGLLKAVARFLNKHLKPLRPIEPGHIVATNGCSSVVEGLSYLLADPGEGILLGRPYYRAFLPDMEMRPQSKVIPVSFGTTDPFSIDAVQHYESAITQSAAHDQPIKALMLCHPHNPLGRSYPVPTIIALMQLCHKHRIHLISDEIYALSTWTNAEEPNTHPVAFTSALAVNTTNIIDPHLLHVIWGMSKDFGANGLRIGFCISQSNPHLVTALQTLSLYTYPSNLTDYVTTQILSDDAFTHSYIRENRARLAKHYSLAARYLRDHDIEVLPGANAAFFIVADIGGAWRRRHPEVGADVDLTAVTRRKLWDKKVYIVDSGAIGSEKPGWYRIVFSQNVEHLMEGLRRVVAAIEDGGDDVDVGKKDSVRMDVEVPVRSKG